MPSPEFSRRFTGRVSLLTRFAVVSLVVVVGIGVALGLVFRESVRNRAITDAARTGEVAANVGVRPFLTVEDLTQDFVPLGPDRVAALDDSLGSSLSPNGVVRVKVWNRQHWLVYSDNVDLRGRWFAGVEILERAFRGEITSEITDLTAPEEREERDFGRLLAVYVPIRATDDGEISTDGTGEVIGAFEIYLPFAPIAAQIRSDTQTLLTALAVGLAILYLSVFRLVARASTRLRTQAEDNLYLASHDTLTGLLNRDAFVARLGHAAVLDQVGERRPTDSQAPDILLLLDLDGFQTINDTLGHDRGDRLLGIVGERIAAAVRDQDVVARMGGDEFAVLLRAVGEGDADALVGRVLAAVETPLALDGLVLEVRASVGAVRVNDPQVDGERLLQQADIAMYAAKEKHSRIEYFHDELDGFSGEALELASEVRTGIGGDQFVLFYQPKVDMSSGALTGCEALIRWNHPTRGFVAPGLFMPTVEQLPIGRELTEWVLARAIADLGAWHASGRTLSVSVNVSARDVADPELPDTIQRMLDRAGVPAGFLTLELTESTMVSDETRALDTLGRLRSMGCGVAIDDFGTGYASLSYVAKLPASELKIDQSYIRAIDVDPQARAIVGHCIGIGHALGLSITAEGIETDEISTILTELSCDTAQGYLIARPAPVEEFLAFVDGFEPVPPARAGSPVRSANQGARP